MLDTLYRQHGGRLYEYFRTRGWDAPAAEDLVQDVFVRLAERLRDENDRPVHLLRKIARGIHVDALRTAGPMMLPFEDEYVHPEQQAVEDTLPAAHSVPFVGQTMATFAGDFDTAVRALPEDERGAFILTELRGLTVREAGDVLGVGKTTVARHAEAARNAIREELIWSS